MPEAVFRISLGADVDGSGTPPPPPPAVPLQAERYKIDIQSYLVSVLGLCQSIEAVNSTSAVAFRPGDVAALGCKQSPANWLWWPYETARDLASNWTSSNLWLSRQPGSSRAPHDVMTLGALSELLHAFGQSLMVNYYERNLGIAISKFGSSATSWPMIWNFGRVVRNAMSHAGTLNFTNANAASVNWKFLTYSPADNGKPILHTDLWPGDLFDLILEMDTAIN